MTPRVWAKQSAESRILEIDCSQAIPTGATLSSVLVKIYTSAGTDVSSAMIQGTPSIDGTTVYVQVKNGSTGNNYNLRIQLTLSNGETAEDDLTVVVQDIS